MRNPLLPATPRMSRLVLPLLVLAAFLCQTGLAGEVPKPVRLDFELIDMPKSGETMTVHCYLDAQHRITNGWASPGSPAAMHHIFTKKLTLEDGVLQGSFRLYRSDNVAVEVDAKLTDGTLRGTYKGSWGENKEAAETKGKLRGRLLTDADLAAVHKIKTPDAWPQWRGPDHGKGTVCPTDKPLIDDPAKARIVWISEAVFPDTPTDSANCTSRWDFASGWSTPVVADGRVYCAYYKGDTDGPIDQKYYDRNVRRRGEWTARNRASIYSEDVLVCVDIETGKTLWKNVYERSGYFQNDYQFGWMQPIVKDGKVYVTGQMGYVYCADAKTGETKWITDTGGAMREKQLLLRENVRKGAQSRKQRDHLSQPLVIADGVVGAIQGNMVGIDAKTGQKQWAVGWGGVAPMVWEHKDRSYFLRDDHCIEPSTGKVVWTGPDGYSVCTGKSIGTLKGDYMVRDAERSGGGLACYKLSLEGPKLMWKLSEKVITRHPSSNMAIHNGHVFALARSKNRAKIPNRWLCIRLTDGKVVAEVPWTHDPRAFAGGQIATDKRIIWWRPASDEVYMLTADPKDFRKLADQKWPGPYRTHVGSALITDGRLITRGVSELYCYDFRDVKTQQPPAPTALKAPPADTPSRLAWPYHETRAAAAKTGRPKELLAALQSGDWLKMAPAGEGLTELGEKASPLAPELRKLLLQAVDDKRFAAVDLLSKTLAAIDKAGAEKTVEALRSKLTTGRAEQAAQALIAFARTAPRETAAAKAELIKLLPSTNAKAAIAAANCLRQIPLGKEAVAPLKNTVLKTEHQPAQPMLKGYCKDALIEIVRDNGPGAAQAAAALVEIHRDDSHFARDVCRLLTIELEYPKDQATAQRYADIALKIADGMKNKTRAFQNMLPPLAEQHENKQEVARVMKALAKEHGDSRTGRKAQAALRKLNTTAK